MAKNCVVWLCGKICDESLKRYSYLKRDSEKMGYDIIWAVDKDKCEQNISDYKDKINLYPFNHDTLINKYRRLSYLNENSFGCFNTILVLLELSEKYPDYDYYWLIEEDVVILGNDWIPFFTYEDDNTMDLLFTHFNYHTLTDSAYEEFYNYDNLIKMAKKDEDDIDLHPMYNSMENIWHAFLPIGRYSKKAVEVLRDYYIKYNGFFEYVVPSVLRWNKLHCEDIGQKFYASFGHDINMATICFSPSFVSSWYYNNKDNDFMMGKIFHPIKLDKKSL